MQDVAIMRAVETIANIVDMSNASHKNLHVVSNNDVWKGKINKRQWNSFVLL